MRSSSRGQKGFTLAEVLGAIAVLIVLLALIVPALINFQRDLRQKDLDSKAEILYVAAQNKLTAMRSSGFSDEYQDYSDSTLVKLPGTPSDRSVQMDDSGNILPLAPLYALNAKDRQTDGTVCSIVMTDDVADNSLLSHYWVVEYAPDSGSVYAVYYSENDSLNLNDYISNWQTYDNLRTRDKRLDDGARIGYYGGDSATTSDTSTLQPTITVSNKEKLEVTLLCARPLKSNPSDHLKFTVTLSDNHGHSYETVYECNSTNKLINEGRSYYVRIVLDDLSSEATRFDNVYGSRSTHSLNDRLIAGDDLNISLRVTSPDQRIDAKTVTAKTNGLFADGSGKTTTPTGTTYEAVIEYGRHLQNLDMLERTPATFTIDAATINKSISFNETLDKEDWYHTYCKNGDTQKTYFNGNDASGRAKFKPLDIASLKVVEGNNSREGDSCTISGLNIAEEGEASAGLFSSIQGYTLLRNISLVGARVNGEADTGALVGSVTGQENYIHDCRVYLSDAQGDLDGKTSEDIWISGARVGGLIGAVKADASLGVADCFAATVQYGSEASGGLVGSSAGTLFVARSYADSYVRGGARAAGLVCDTDGSVTFENCYAAGFLYGTELAGLSCGNLTKVTGTYTACAARGGSSLKYATAPSIGEAARVRYLHSGDADGDDAAGISSLAGLSNTDLLAALGVEGAVNPFTTDTTKTTHPYNLDGQALVAYAYPRLKANDHYGDWESDFKSGSLVYYEKYVSGDFGFYGADVESTLRSGETIVGDGYGIVYREGDTLPEKATITVDEFSAYTINPASSEEDYYTVYANDGAEYHVYPLPMDRVNPVLSETTGFYRRVEVAEQSRLTTKNVFYFNPHFAKTVQYGSIEDTVSPALASDDRIAVRTPRQLLSLSKNYDYYADATRGRTFRQERDLDYATYDWADFYDSGQSSVDEQGPIGYKCSFAANYDGDCYYITGVSFYSEDADYVGLFGYNEGVLSDIVLRWDYDESGPIRYAARGNEIGANQHVYIGTLVGCNGVDANGKGGIVTNCAVSGYSFEGSKGMVNAYSNSNVYVGGFAGANLGEISNCAADCPIIRVSGLYAQGYVGGFVGMNDGAGSISDCYDLGHVEASYVRGGNVRLAGFAGLNDGSIRSCYCATSINGSGDASHTYAFAPRGGTVAFSYYLTEGTFTYVDHLRSYNYDKNRTSAVGASRNVLMGQRGTSWAVQDNTFDYSKTYPSDSRGYPYRATVRDRSGNWVHFGNWQDDANLGGMGVFYWEHEQGGANDGYHITYIGVDDGETVKGTTLCTSHDDGGLITEYGYGYFATENEADHVRSNLTNLAYSGNKVNSEAQASLQNQIGGSYVFYPYTTRLASEAGDGDYLYLSTSASTASVREGTWTLEYGDYSYVFEVAPFFANALSCAGAGSVTGSDGVETNYSVTPGEKANNYEIRSLQQLQYINWNAQTQNTTQFAEKGEGDHEGVYKCYPYLQYAYITELIKGKAQTEEEVYNLRSRQYWRQTHDVGVAKGEKFSFTPIAASASASAKDDREVVLFAWFGGDYDGGSYKIQNFDITSDSYTVGLFGVTVGANLSNIIIYSDQGNKIMRQTPKSGGQINESPGAYSLGGLVGVAYDYQQKTTPSTIENCAIAGYSIVDNSSQKHRQGGGCIGGLLGVGNVALKNCSAVTDIDINCTHDNGRASWGDYIRVGGLMGSAQYSVVDCYAGGEIRVAEGTIEELYDNNNKKVPFDSAIEVDRRKNVHIYVAGIAGSAYTSNYVNFTGNADAHDGHGEFYNCYSYVKLPDLVGTIKGVSYIAGPADRFGIKDASIDIENCYYLESVNRGISYTIPTYWTSDSNPKGYQMTDEDFEKILNGDLSPNKKILYPDSDKAQLPGENPKPIQYEELSSGNTGFLGSEWSTVTVKEGGSDIHGKYSFPGNDSKLKGKDYPFPTIIKQPDLTYGGPPVNVHYGMWTLNGTVWSEGMADLDIFTDMKDEGSSAGWAEKTFTLEDPLNQLEGKTLDASSFNFDHEGIVEFVSANKVEGKSKYEVTFRALKTGAVTITEKKSGSGAYFVLRVTADLNVTSEPEQLVNYVGNKSSLTLHALSGGDTPKDYAASGNGSWTFDQSSLIDIEKTGSNTWEVTHQGRGSLGLGVLFTYKYHDHNYTARIHVPIMTPGVIGLSGDPALSEDGKASYNEVDRQVSATPVEGTDQTYTENYPAMPAGTYADFYFYESVSDLDAGGKALKGVKVQSITLKYGDNQPFEYDQEGTPDTNQGFKVTIGDADKDAVSDLNFQYLPCRIRYSGDVAIGKTTITIEFTHDEDASTSYIVSTTIDVPKYIATFKAGEGEGSDVIVKGSGTGAIKLPSSEGFSKTGYSFSGWSDGTESGLQPGATYLLTADTTFIAEWAANSYTVRLNSNYESGPDAIDVPCTYDKAKTLPANTFTRENYRFVGWATSATGAVAYKDKDEVLNLTEDPDGVVDLYAVWGAEHTLTLDSVKTEKVDPTPESQSITVCDYFADLPDYEPPRAWGYVLDGWYTSADDGGTKVLDADGSIVGEVEGYTTENAFNLGADKTLYAHWAPGQVKLKANGTETSYDIPALVDGTASYTRPRRTYNELGYKLDGWYTENTGDGDKMVVDADGQIVDENRALLTNGRTLHARWTQSPKYDFNPYGEKWNKNAKGDKVKIDFKKGDYLKVTMDLSTCKSNVEKQNLISFGNERLSDYGCDHIVHFYYTPSTRELKANINSKATDDYYYLPEGTTQLEIVFKENELIVNNARTMKSTDYPKMIKKLEDAIGSGEPIFYVGSVQGTNRSYASHVTVTVCNDSQEDPPYEGFYLFD